MQWFMCLTDLVCVYVCACIHASLMHVRQKITQHFGPVGSYSNSTMSKHSMLTLTVFNLSFRILYL